MDNTTATAARHTALYDVHTRLGAKMVEFAGYMMPISYRGIVAEHQAVRERVGLFDVSHMGEVYVTGPRALAFVQSITVNDASTLADGQAQYSAMCTEDGGIVDDLLVYRIDPEFYMLVINASNIEMDFAWMRRHAIDGAELRNVSDDVTLIAIQGPKSIETLKKVTPVDLEAIDYYHFVRGTVAGVEGIISRTGYTGEVGFELYLPGDEASSTTVWNALMQAGEEFGIEPAGLGARDTLRMEMGYCLYGNDIDATTNTIEAGLGWITKLDKGEFVGHDALARVKEEKPSRRLVGFEMNERGIPRQGYAILADGEEVGVVTSGTQSPTLGHGIGLGYVRTGFNKAGTAVAIRIRDKEIPATVVRPPMLKRG